MDLSIIIVNYNTKDLLEKSINSIISNPPTGEFEIIVVDNNSTDGSCEYLQKIKIDNVLFILSDTNLGFSKANNKGLAISKGEYILFLNPDTEMLPNTIDNCLNYLKTNNDVGALGCRVDLTDGSLDLACRRSFPTLKNSFYRFTKLSFLFPKSKTFASYNLTYLPVDQVYEVDCIVGAFMLIPKVVLHKCSSFDEDYFMYGEDIDLCYRIKKNGYKIIYFGTSSIIHHKRASSKKSSTAQKSFYESMLLYYNKHHRQNHSKFTSKLVEFAVKFIEKTNL